nr:PAP2 superfamily [uncultured bacterium]
MVLARAAPRYSKIGDQPPLLAVSGAVLAFGLLSDDSRVVRAGSRMIAAHLLATAVKNAIKGQVDRTRPTVLVKEGRYDMKPGHTDTKEQTSFPSGHSAGAAAVACAFVREFPDQALAAYGAAGAIALAQIPRCAHYPTDVGSGIAIGWLSEAVTSKLLDRFFKGSAHLPFSSAASR